MQLDGSLDTARQIWELAHPDATALGRLHINEQALTLPSVYRVDQAASACIGVAAMAASELWRSRSGHASRVELDSRHAAVSYRSERYQRLDGDSIEHPVPAQSYFRDRDGRWMQLHMVYPHHRMGIVELLGVDAENAEVAAAMSKLDALQLEQRLADAGLPGYAQRSRDEWRQGPQYAALAAQPLLTIEQIGDAPPLELSANAERILDGIRVLDLTRVIAGPVCGRTLAAHGADVMRVHPPALTEVLGLLIDGGRGKRCTNLDLRTPAERQDFEALLSTAHVLVQGFRPGGLSELGFGPHAIAEHHPGIVYVSLSAWGEQGPWAPRHGFDSLVQTATGYSHAGAQATGSEQPLPLPCQALDHSTGYLAAFGAMVALKRRVEQGGSWLVRVSLAQTAHWLDELGPIEALAVPEPGDDEVDGYLHTLESSFGTLSTTRPVARFDQAAPYWATGAVPLGHNAPHW